MTTIKYMHLFKKKMIDRDFGPFFLLQVKIPEK